MITWQVVGVDRGETLPVDHAKGNVAYGSEGRAVGAVHLAAAGTPVQQSVAIRRGSEHADLYLGNVAARSGRDGMHQVQRGIG